MEILEPWGTGALRTLFHSQSAGLLHVWPLHRVSTIFRPSYFESDFLVCLVSPLLLRLPFRESLHLGLMRTPLSSMPLDLGRLLLRPDSRLLLQTFPFQLLRPCKQILTATFCPLNLPVYKQPSLILLQTVKLEQGTLGNSPSLLKHFQI